MNRGATLGLAFAVLAASSQAAARNIVLILADDQGWTGSSVQMDDGVPGAVSDLYRTPNLERIAAAGMTFSNAYAPAPNCSPTRMSIQTGKTAARLGATDIIDVVPDAAGVAGIQFFHDAMYREKPMLVAFPVAELAEAETTIPEFLKAHDANYMAGHFGKWHMGGESPSRHGYDGHGGLTTNAEGRAGPPDPKRSGAVTDAAIAFMRRQAEADRPFFVQVSYYAVHTPVLALGDTIDRFKHVASVHHTNTAYAAMTAEMDAGVGRILDALETLRLDDDTYVIYTSDNGGEADTYVTNNRPLRLGKTHVFEGGIRVPLLIQGPGIPAGSRSHVPAIGYDFLPTIRDWVGARQALPEDIDGGSLAGVLANGGTGEVERGTEALIWYYGAYRNMKHVAPQAAIRRGDHKLVWELDTDRAQLFDLKLDLGETTDLSRFRPDVARALLAELRGYLEDVGTTFPTHNPNYDPAKDLGLGWWREANPFGP